MDQFQILPGHCVVHDDYIEIESNKITRAKRLLKNSHTLQIILSTTALYLILSIVFNTSIFVREVAVNGLVSGVLLGFLLLSGKYVYNRYFGVSDETKIEFGTIQQIILSKPNKIGHPHMIIQYQENDSEKLRVVQLMPTWSKSETDTLSDVEDILVQNGIEYKRREDPK
ncbi:hypothetical protein EXE51_14285 [Halorubrum sp. CGM5_25_10-8B]|uniref:hypothetical protein n=1 Tax=Halorubrum TaxID=56688 RepID=UPI000A9B9F54|nr:MULTISPECIES: hypothetical protein [Halorubrum]TKX35448.1 hypothetical protein EXE51_14285 [Halorubrum sp. CGM5_25_10-8B]